MDSQDYYVSNERILSIALSLFGALLGVAIYWLIRLFISRVPNLGMFFNMLYLPLHLSFYSIILSLPFFTWLFIRKINSQKHVKIISNWKKVRKSTLKGSLVIAVFFIFVTGNGVYSY